MALRAGVFFLILLSLGAAPAVAQVRSAFLDELTWTETDGVYGDPRRSTAELGKLGVDLVIERTVAAVRKAVARR